MKINIYQINQGRDTQRLKFMGLDAVRKVLRSAEPDCAAYDKVYSGDVKCRNLEDVFVLFQSGRSEDFQGHSLSVSDVVEVEDAASITPGFYFCDSIGFKEIPFQPELANDVVQAPTIQVVLVEPGKLARIAEIGTTLDAILQNLAQLKALFDKQWESIVGNCDTFLYLGGNEQSTHEYVSKLLGKQTIDTNTYGQSKGRSGSYTTNFQTAGRELMTPDEVRMLDNRYALLFIRGERPVKDLKYNILKHPNVALTTDGQAAAYQHGTDPLSVAAISINLEKLKQAAPEDTGTGDYVVLTEEEVYDFMRKKAQENNQNQNSNYQEITYEKHHPQHHPSHHPSDF